MGVSDHKSKTQKTILVYSLSIWKTNKSLVRIQDSWSTYIYFFPHLTHPRLVAIPCTHSRMCNCSRIWLWTCNYYQVRMCHHKWLIHSLEKRACEHKKAVNMPNLEKICSFILLLAEIHNFEILTKGKFKIFHNSEQECTLSNNVNSKQFSTYHTLRQVFFFISLQAIGFSMFHFSVLTFKTPVLQGC